MADDPMEGQNGRSIEERAGDGDGQMEAFPMGAVDGDAKVTLRTLIRGGEPVSFTVSMRSAEVPLRGGLVDPRKTVRLLVTCEAFDGGLPVPQREDGKVVSWKVRQSLRPTYVEPVGPTDGDLLVHYHRELLASSPSEAAVVAERIAAQTAEALQTA
jgi:hypothetical protein